MLASLAARHFRARTFEPIRGPVEFSEEIVIPLGGGDGDGESIKARYAPRTGRYDIPLSRLAIDDEEAIILSVVLAVAAIELH